LDTVVRGVVGLLLVAGGFAALDAGVFFGGVPLARVRDGLPVSGRLAGAVGFFWVRCEDAGLVETDRVGVVGPLVAGRAGSVRTVGRPVEVGVRFEVPGPGLERDRRSSRLDGRVAGERESSRPDVVGRGAEGVRPTVEGRGDGFRTAGVVRAPGRGFSGRIVTGGRVVVVDGPRAGVGCATGAGLRGAGAAGLGVAAARLCRARAWYRPSSASKPAFSWFRRFASAL
jgi:hypothetical protein